MQMKNKMFNLVISSQGPNLQRMTQLASLRNLFYYNIQLYTLSMNIELLLFMASSVKTSLEYSHICSVGGVHLSHQGFYVQPHAVPRARPTRGSHQNRRQRVHHL